jgi:ketosteroid isomerase-like protein
MREAPQQPKRDLVSELDDMSENAELVRRSFEAMSAWDAEALLRLYDTDVEFLPLTGTRVESGGYRGHEGVRAYFAEARDLWDVMEPEGHEYRDLGDRVLRRSAATTTTSRRLATHERASAPGPPTCALWTAMKEGLLW